MKIFCPTCEVNGLKRTVARVDGNDIVVNRASELLANATGDYTIIRGDSFELLCGRCKEPVFRKIPVLIQQTTTMLFGTI